MDKTRTVGQKWLANELELHFLTKKVYQTGGGGGLSDENVIDQNFSRLIMKSIINQIS